MDSPDTWADLRVVYPARILNDQQIDKDLDEVTYGLLEVQRITVVLDNRDNGVSALWGMENSGVTLWRYDRIKNVLIREFDGVLDTVTLETAMVTLDCTNHDLAALDVMIPRFITNTTWHPEGLDIGWPFVYVAGTVPRVRLPNIVNNLPGSLFYYLAGLMRLTVSAVYRNRVGDNQLEPLDPSEYVVTSDGGSTVIRTFKIQRTADGGYHEIYADLREFVGSTRSGSGAGSGVIPTGMRAHG
jgi:hypothetical protein